MNTIVISWSEWMVRVSLQATVVVCVAFVLSRVFCVWFRAPAWAELWLWRLAFVKLLLLLVITGSIAIPVLPSRQSLAIRTEAYDSNPARSQSPSVVSEAGSRELAGPGSAVTGPVAKSQLVFDGVNVGQDGSVAVDFVEPVHVVASSSLKVNWIALLFGGWVLGVAVNVTFMLRHGRQAWCRTLSELNDSSIKSECARQCEAFRIRRCPRLAVSNEFSGPVLVGLFRPTIVFSQSLLRSCNDSQLRSVIAHELAHLKSCDLVWSLLPAVVHLLLYFHPLVWLARDRFRLASELAADEAAILKVADSVAGYGESLLRIALLGRDAVRRGVFPCEVAAVHTSSALRTRLYAMKTFSICSTPRACIFAGLLGLLGILGLAPIQFVPRLLAASPEEEVNSFGRNLNFELKTEEGLAKHWGGGGSGYALTLDDDNPHAGATCGWIAGGADQGFGTFTQCLDPGELVGKRIAFRGYLRSDLRGTGGLWMRVDAEDNTVSFDNMQDRPVTGKTGWSQHTIVLDVPLEATRICFGFLMSGKGSLWGDGFEIELLGPSGEGPAVTGVENLNFGAFSRLENLGFETASKVNPAHADSWGGGGAGYELKRDAATKHAGIASGRIAKIGDAGSFGTYTQMFPAKDYLGKRVRWSGYLKTDNAESAGLWMRVDGPGRKVTAFDNMQTRAVTGTTDWAEYEVILDVAKDAEFIALGFLLSGDGTIWGDDLRLEIVGAMGEGPETTDML